MRIGQSGCERPGCAATYKDREGNELAQSEAVATNVPDGTAYARFIHSG